MKYNTKNNFFWLKIIAAIGFVVLAVSLGTVFLNNTATANNIQSKTIPQAVIIDQLYDDIPNPLLHELASKLFETAGYKVDIFTTKDITLDFYKKLPSMNYDFVLIRSHGAAEENDQDSITLFTGEKYQIDKYTSEQLLGQVKRGTPLAEVIFYTNGTDSTWVIANDTYRTLTVQANFVTQSKEEYFLITPSFVDWGMEGKFSDTIFVLGGCSTMQKNTMAQSLIGKGASAVVGWDDQVGSVDNDIMILSLLERFLADKMELKDAADSVMNQLNKRPMLFPGKLKVYSEIV